MLWVIVAQTILTISFIIYHLCIVKRLHKYKYQTWITQTLLESRIYDMEDKLFRAHSRITDLEEECNVELRTEKTVTSESDESVIKWLTN